MDLYDELGVARDATQDEIKGAFRRRAKETHPDAGGSAEKFAAVAKAHTVLSDPESRARYDATGEAEPRADQLESDAISALDQFLMTALGDERAEHRDIIGSMRAQLLREQLQVKSDRTKAEKGLARFRDVATRFTTTGEKDPIAGLFAHKLRQLEGMKAAIERRLQVLARAEELLKDYSFRPKAAPEPYGGQMSASTFTITGFV